MLIRCTGILVLVVAGAVQGAPEGVTESRLTQAGATALTTITDERPTTAPRLTSAPAAAVATTPDQRPITATPAFVAAGSQAGVETTPFVVVLGVAQDGGRPQAGCDLRCCWPAQGDPTQHRRVASLAIVDPRTDHRWLVDATPDFPAQLHALDLVAAPSGPPPGLDGIFLTHAHIGHYTGLMHLGREVLGARDVPVYAMPRMRRFLETSGPWSQLVDLHNVRLRRLQANRVVELGESLGVTPWLVPHRDEFSETVGFRISGPSRSVLYIPDIDKWTRWEQSLPDVLATVDRAYLDGTFYDSNELPGRDMASIPHPFIVETMARLAALPASERAKVRFIHLNHTNPAHESDSVAARAIRAAGMDVAHEGERFGL